MGVVGSGFAGQGEGEGWSGVAGLRWGWWNLVSLGLAWSEDDGCGCGWGCDSGLKMTVVGLGWSEDDGGGLKMTVYWTVILLKMTVVGVAVAVVVFWVLGVDEEVEVMN